MNGNTEVKINWGIKRDIPKENLENYHDTFDPFTKQKVRYYRKRCPNCGHSISFLTNHYVICDYCGIKVYPTEKAEFKDKMILELRKKEKENK